MSKTLQSHRTSCRLGGQPSRDGKEQGRRADQWVHQLHALHGEVERGAKGDRTRYERGGEGRSQRGKECGWGTGGGEWEGEGCCVGQGGL